MFKNYSQSISARTLMTRTTTALLLGTVLAGCASSTGGPGHSRYEPTYLRLTEEHAFSQALRKNYLELATNAYDRGDIDRSDFYSLRALMAGEGKLAQPTDASRHSRLSAGVSAETQRFGKQLSMLLMTGVRTGSPDLAARAQAAFDCWVLESAPDGDPQIAASCRYNALNALAELDGASVGGQLDVAGGPRTPEGQTYVIEAGQPSPVIRAHGVTIEVITEQVPTSVQHQATTTYNAAPQTVSVQQAVPVQMMQMEAPMMAPAALPPIATVPIVDEKIVSVGALPDHYSDHSGFTSVPVISPVMLETVPMADPVMTPVPAIETVPIMNNNPNMGQVDLGAYEYQQTPQTTYQEQIQPEYQPQYQSEYEPYMEQGAVVPMQNIETFPVYNTEAVATTPIVAMAPAAYTNEEFSTGALLEAQASRNTDFAVFFGFDSDEITLEGEDVLADTIERIKLSGAQQIGLMGYTDSSGNARYNQLLAMRRAQAVRKYLQESLGNSVSFEILPVGEVQAVAEGGDGVKDALNRKVEISIR